MTPIGWIVIAACILIGIIIGYIISKRQDKKIKKVIKDPHLLAEKLKAHGKIYDGVKELDIKIGTDEKTGKDIVMVEEKESKKPVIKLSKSYKKKKKKK